MTLTFDEPMRTSELLRNGVNRRELEDLVTAGILVHPFHGVVAPPSWADTIEQRVQCLKLVVPSHVIVCDRTAAWMHGVDCFDSQSRGRGMPIDVVSTLKSPTRRHGVYGGERDLLPTEVMMLDGVRVTTPLRTSMDLACRRGPAMSLGVLEAFMRQHEITRADYLRALPRHRGRRGVIQLRRMIGHASPLSESFGESFTKAAFVVEEIPVPQQQLELDVPGWGLARLDFADPPSLTGLEYDGEDAHGEEQAQHDRDRRAALSAIGWLILVIRKEDLAAQRRVVWLNDFQTARHERQPDFRRTFPRGESRHFPRFTRK